MNEQLQPLIIRSICPGTIFLWFSFHIFSYIELKHAIYYFSCFVEFNVSAHTYCRWLIITVRSRITTIWKNRTCFLLMYNKKWHFIIYFILMTINWCKLRKYLYFNLYSNIRGIRWFSTVDWRFDGYFFSFNVH
jgi:hypothetical protein